MLNEDAAEGVLKALHPPAIRLPARLRRTKRKRLAQAVLCCAFAAADIAVAIAAVRPSELRLSAGNAMLTVGEASHC